MSGEAKLDRRDAAIVQRWAVQTIAYAKPGIDCASAQEVAAKLWGDALAATDADVQRVSDEYKKRVLDWICENHRHG